VASISPENSYLYRPHQTTSPTDRTWCDSGTLSDILMMGLVCQCLFKAMMTATTHGQLRTTLQPLATECPWYTKQPFKLLLRSTRRVQRCQRLFVAQVPRTLMTPASFCRANNVPPETSCLRDEFSAISDNDGGGRASALGSNRLEFIHYVQSI
jgi:hypothetical protein